MGAASVGAALFYLHKWDTRMEKTGPKFTPEQRILIEETAWKLRVGHGMPQRQIATEIRRQHGLVVDRSQISRVLAKVRREAVKRLDDLAEQTLIEQADQSDMIYGMALAAWRADGTNPQFLQAALAAMKHKADILHLKVIRLEHTGKDGGAIDVSDAKERLALLLTRQAERGDAGGSAGGDA
jgi:hypothetical protein